MNVLALIEQQVRTSTLELIAAGSAVGEVAVVTLAEPDEATLALLGDHGVAKVYRAKFSPEPAWRAGATSAAVVVAAQEWGADLVLAAPAATEVAALAAARLGAGLVTEAAQVSVFDGGLRIRKSVFAGTWDIVVEVAGRPAVVVLQPNAVTPEAVRRERPQVETIKVAVAPSAVMVASRQERPATDRPALEDAAVVVAGGRGTAGNFGPIFDLADALGAAVGATRDVVFDGGFDRYIGTTGVVVAPRLFVSAGISGAPYHTGGMRGSHTIVAVNNDSEAPIFEISDFGVVGDLAAVLPAAAAEIRRRRSVSAESP